jgi:hypothetical protein
VQALCVCASLATVIYASMHLLHQPSLLVWKVLRAPTYDAFWNSCSFALQHMVWTTHLYDASTGAMVRKQDVPWEAAQQGARFMAATYVLVRLPANGALLASALLPSLRGWYARRFEWLYVVAAICDMAQMGLVELVMFSPRVRAVLLGSQWGDLSLAMDYSWLVGYEYLVVGGLLLSFCSRGTFGPCRVFANELVLSLRALFFCGALLWSPALRPLMFRSPHLAAQMGLIAVSAAMTSGTNDRLRARCALELASRRVAEEAKVKSKGE